MSYFLYHVQSGDTLSQIAHNWLRQSNLYPTILDANGDPIANPDLISVGQLLVIPNLDEYVEYEVQSEDTLSALASAFFGKSNLYNLILDNGRQPIPNPNNITVGQRLRVPVHARMSTVLTPNFLANLTYQAFFGETTLANGIHSFDNDDFLGERSTTRLTEIAYGDLTGNGVDDASVILSSHTNGTTGYFSEVYGVPIGLTDSSPVAVQLVSASLGDRFYPHLHFIRDQQVHILGNDHLQPLFAKRLFAPFGDALAIGLNEVI